tara:strand:+ start:72 stop:458 length:387 start_codon:yes stop_codon:yes gene_type:complete
MKKLLLLFVLTTVTNIAFASFPVKTEKAKTVLTEQVSIETDTNILTETEAAQIAVIESIEEYPAPSRDAIWMGIVSFSCAMLAWAVFWPLAIPAVIFGAMGLNKRLKGFAISGMTLGVLALIVIAAVL